MKFDNNENITPVSDKKSVNVNSLKFFENIQAELNQLASQITALSNVVTGMETVVRTGTINAENINASDTVATKDLSATGNTTLNDVNAHDVGAHDIEATGELKAASAKITGKAKANEIEASVVNAETMNVDNLNFDTFNADNANINDLDAGDINATNVKATKLEGSQGDIDTVNATDVNSTDVTATGKTTTKDLENTGAATLKDVDADKINSDLIHDDILTVKRQRINADENHVAFIPENGYLCIPVVNGGKVSIFVDKTTDNEHVDREIIAGIILDYAIITAGKPSVKVTYAHKDKFFEKFIMDDAGNVYFKRSDSLTDARRVFYSLEISEANTPLTPYALTTYAVGNEPFADAAFEAELNPDNGLLDFSYSKLIKGHMKIDGNLDVTGTVNFGAGEIDHAKYLGKSTKITGDDDGNFIASENADIGGDLSVGGDAAITGDATVGGDANVTGEVTADSVEAANGFTGNLTGDVTGDVTGNVTGNVTGDVTGDLTGLAEKATGDKNGDDITTTYQKKLTAGSNLTIQEISGVLTISCNIDTMNFKGSVTNQSDLPSSDNDEGDIYNVTSDGTWWCWDGTAWCQVGTVIDLKQIAKTTLNVTYVILTVADWEYMVSHIGNPGPNDDFSKIALLCDIPATATGLGSIGTDLFIGYGNPTVYTDCSFNNSKNVTFSGITTTQPNNAENCKFVNCTLSGSTQFDLENIKNCELDFDCSTVDKITFQNIKNCKIKIRGIGYFTQNFALENVSGCNFVFADNLAIRECLFYYAKNVFDCTFSCETHGLNFPVVKNSAFTIEFKDCKFDMIEDSLITKGVFTGCEINVLITTTYDSNTYKANITGGEFNKCKVFAEINLASASTFCQAPITGGKFYVCKLETKATNYNNMDYGTIFIKSTLKNNEPDSIVIANCKILTQTGILANCSNSEIEITVADEWSYTPFSNDYSVFDSCFVKFEYPNYRGGGYLVGSYLKILNSTFIINLGDKVPSPQMIPEAVFGIYSIVTRSRIKIIADFSTSDAGQFKLGNPAQQVVACSIELCNTKSSAYSALSINAFLSGSKGLNNVAADTSSTGGSNVGSITNNYQL